MFVSSQVRKGNAPKFKPSSKGGGASASSSSFSSSSSSAAAAAALAAPSALPPAGPAPTPTPTPTPAPTPAAPALAPAPAPAHPLPAPPPDPLFSSTTSNSNTTSTSTSDSINTSHNHAHNHNASPLSSRTAATATASPAKHVSFAPSPVAPVSPRHLLRARSPSVPPPPPPLLPSDRPVQSQSHDPPQLASVRNKGILVNTSANPDPTPTLDEPERDHDADAAFPPAPVVRLLAPPKIMSAKQKKALAAATATATPPSSSDEAGTNNLVRPPASPLKNQSSRAILAPPVRALSPVRESPLQVLAPAPEPEIQIQDFSDLGRLSITRLIELQSDLLTPSKRGMVERTKQALRKRLRKGRKPDEVISDDNDDAAADNNQNANVFNSAPTIERSATPQLSNPPTEPRHQQKQQQQQNVGPKIQIVDGQIVIDETSLVINAPVPMDSDETNQDMEIIDESAGALHITSASFRFNKITGKRWKKDDVDLFYEYFGTNFEVIALLFPKLTRRHIISRFRLEERRDPARISRALRSRMEPPSELIERMKTTLATRTLARTEAATITAPDQKDSDPEDVVSVKPSDTPPPAHSAHLLRQGAPSSADRSRANNMRDSATPSPAPAAPSRSGAAAGGSEAPSAASAASAVTAASAAVFQSIFHKAMMKKPETVGAGGSASSKPNTATANANAGPAGRSFKPTFKPSAPKMKPKKPAAVSTTPAEPAETAQTAASSAAPANQPAVSVNSSDTAAPAASEGAPQQAPDVGPPSSATRAIAIPTIRRSVGKPIVSAALRRNAVEVRAAGPEAGGETANDDDDGSGELIAEPVGGRGGGVDDGDDGGGGGGDDDDY
ncbi:hypothetical protein HDU83_006489 [Entophlyctis luteolus]|nr:hypothetical protein HDU83_006489 [Entophlyctis luteolus]